MPKMQKKQSKRKTCRLRYKIIKKAAEHNRKLRRELKNKSKKVKNKDPGVPNSYPFKEEIIKESENKKQRESENRKQRVKDLKQAQKDSRSKRQMENRGLFDLIRDVSKNTVTYEASKNTNEYEKYSVQVLEGVSTETSKNFKSYYKELKKVVEVADVILEVLDARDPLGSRCPQLEEMVIKSRKRLVLVLNKIDLIPRINLDAWLTYLRKELPTVAFKSSTQTQSTNLSQCRAVAAIHLTENLQASRRCVGASFLMKVLGNYCRNQNIQTSIKVGVVGFPNVGKSSVINSLKRARSCTVGATPGITKSIQEVALDKHIKIIDSPGVVFAQDGSPTALALRNAVNVDNLSDVVTPAEAIVQRADHKQLCLHYSVPEFSSVYELLCLLANRMGKFKKGGSPDVNMAARKLINDWNSGKIKYYTHPPEEYKQSVHISAEYVAEMSKAFDISSVDDESLYLDKIPEILPSEGVVAKSVEPTVGMVCDLNEEINENEDVYVNVGDIGLDFEEEMEADDKVLQDSSVSVSFVTKKKSAKEKDDGWSDQVIPDELRKNRKIKRLMRNIKRRKRKNEKRAEKLSDKIETVLSLD